MNVGLGTEPELSALRQVLNGGMWSTSDWLDKHPDQATATVVALWKALDYMHTNTADAAEIVRVAAWKELDPKVFQLAWQGEMPLAPKTPAVTQEGLKALIDYAGLTDKDALKLTPNQIGTNKYVDLAQNSSGVRRDGLIDPD